MTKEAKFEPELLSVNAFRDLATNGSLQDESIEAIAAVLSSVYDADTLTERFDILLHLIELLSPLEQNHAASKLLYQCHDFVQLILGATTPAEVIQRLAHRALRTPFQPNFLFDAPRDAQLRWLVDALADWRQETDSALKQEKFHKIALASSYKRHNPVELKPRKNQSELYSRLPERRMFNALSIAHNLLGAFVHRTSKLARKDYQEYEFKQGIKEASSAEFQEKLAFPMGGRIYKIHLNGSDDDRQFKVKYWSTKDCVAHEVHYGEASFVVTISGHILLETSGNIGTRFTRNPFFAGRISIDDEGRLRSYNNFSECFDHDERNLVCVTRYFRELGFIGANPGVVAGLVRQREFVGDQEAFKRYAQKFDAFALWQANENLFSVSKGEIFLPNKESVVKLEHEAIAEQKEQLDELRANVKKGEQVPTWLTQWEEVLGNPQHTFPPLVDHLNTDPVNLHGFLAAKEKRPAEDLYKLFPSEKAAEDDPAAGIRHDFDRGKLRQERLEGKEKLQKLRRKIKLKDRLDSKKWRCVFVDRRPNDDAMEYGVLYFYPHHDSETHCSYCVLLEEGNKDLIHESQIATVSNSKTKDLRDKLKKAIQPKPGAAQPVFSKQEEKALKELALRMRRFEQILMTSPHKLPCDSAEEMRAIKTQVQANVSVDIAMAFFDELRVVDRREQVNNFFGRVYLFHTNRGNESPENKLFDLSKKDYLAKLELPHINHYDQREWDKSLSAETEDDDDDQFSAGPLVRQSSYFQ